MDEDRNTDVNDKAVEVSIPLRSEEQYILTANVDVDDEQIKNCNEIMSEDELSECLEKLKNIPEQMSKENPELFETVIGVPKNLKQLTSVAEMMQEIENRIGRDENWYKIDHPVDHSCDIHQVRGQWNEVVDEEEHQQMVEECVETWDLMWKNHKDIMLETMPDYLRDENTEDLKGLLVFYINVGQLSPPKAEIFIEAMKERVADVKRRMPLSYDFMWLPVRNENTRIEILRF